jgi:hypothetical protein
MEPRVSPPVLRPLTIGEILDGAFTVYRRHFGVLFATAGLLLAPAELAGLLPGTMLPALLAFVWSVAAQAPLVRHASVAILGGTPTIRDGLAAGGRRVPALLAVSAFATLLIGLVTGPLVGVAVLLTVMALPSSTGGGLQALNTVAIVTVAGTVAFAPASLLMIRWFFAWSVSVLEPGVPALRRSASLARGAYWRIGLLWTLAWLITGLPATAIGVGQGLAQARAGEHLLSVGVVAGAVAAWIVTALAAPFTAALYTLAYYDQRVRREGFDVQLAMAGVGGGAPDGARAR